MAAQLQHEKRTLSIKLENGENNEGEMTYTTKSFGKLKSSASADCIYAVAEGINKSGELIVHRIDNGEAVTVYAGEVSVRGIYGYV